jgi:hypothetical protein
MLATVSEVRTLSVQPLVSFERYRFILLRLPQVRMEHQVFTAALEAS